MSATKNIIVHWPDGCTTVCIESTIEDLKAMFIWAPDTRIEQIPTRLHWGNEQVSQEIEDTYKTYETIRWNFDLTYEKSYVLTMATVDYWEDGVMTKE